MPDYFYQVYQAYAPSGGISPVDDTRYSTLEEARGAAEALKLDPDKRPASSGLPRDYSYTHDFGNGHVVTYPTFWAQPILETSNGTLFRITE